MLQRSQNYQILSLLPRWNTLAQTEWLSCVAGLKYTRAVVNTPCLPMSHRKSSYLVTQGRESHDQGQRKPMETSPFCSLCTGSLLRDHQSSKRQAIWGWYELLPFDIYSFYFRPEGSFMHSKVQVSFFSVMTITFIKCHLSL